MPFGAPIARLLVGGFLFPVALAAQVEHRLAAADRARVAETIRLATALGDRLWPGLERTPFAILVVNDSAEYLLGHPSPTSDFGSIGRDSVLKLEISVRPRIYAPTLLATFPAVGGLPTIVVGTARHTGKSSSDWVLTLLHEHFHQWQYTLPDYYRRVGLLDLAGSDTTGRWMLNYPFPYDSTPVRQAATGLAKALSAALRTASEGRDQAVAAVVTAGRALRDQLAPADRRYLEFQLWQEGVARFIEYKAARLAAGLGRPAPDFAALPDYEPYSAVTARQLRSLRSQLDRFDLGRDRRVSFYSVGAALALVLDQTRPGWEQLYRDDPFVLTPLLSAPQGHTPRSSSPSTSTQ